MTEDGGKFARISGNYVLCGHDDAMFNFGPFLSPIDAQSKADLFNAAHEKLVTEAREEGRRAGLEEAVKVCEVVGFSSIGERIKALKEKNQ